MQTTAQAWLVLEQTHSALLLGLVGVLQYLPIMLFSLFGGVLADRLPKRTLLLVTQFLTLVQMDEKKLSTSQSLREGLFYVWHMPAVLLVIVLIGVIALFGVNFNVMLPLYATDVFHTGSVGFGFISAAYELGALFSALWVAWGNRKPSIRFLLSAAFAFSVIEIVFALSHVYLLSFPLLASVGFAQVVMSATANTTIQTVTPNHLRGRVISVYLLVYAGGMPLGNLLPGELTTLFGAPTAFLIGAIPCLVAAIVAWLLRKSAEKSLAASVATMKRL